MSNNNPDTPAFDVDAELEAAFAAAQPRQEAEPPMIWQIEDTDLARNNRPAPPQKKPWWMWVLVGVAVAVAGLMVVTLAGGFDPKPVIIGGQVMAPTAATPSMYVMSSLPWLAGLALAGVVVWYLKDKERRKALWQKPLRFITWPWRATVGRFFGRKAQEATPVDAAAQANAAQDEPTAPKSVPQKSETVAAVRRRELTDLLVGGVLVVMVVINTLLAVKYVLPPGVYGAKVLYIAAVVLLQVVALMLLYSIYSSSASKCQVALGKALGTIVAVVMPVATALVGWFAGFWMVYTPWLADKASDDVVAMSRWVMWLCFLAVFYIVLTVVWAVTRPLKASSDKAARNLKEAEAARAAAEAKKQAEAAQAAAKKKAEEAAEAARVAAEAKRAEAAEAARVAAEAAEAAVAQATPVAAPPPTQP